MHTIIYKNTPTFFLNKDFQTIQIKVIFPFRYDDSSLGMMHLLPGMLHNVCAKYPTEKELSQYTKSIYVLACFCSCTTMVDIGYFTFNFMIPDIHSLKKDYLEEQIKLLSEIIYNPKLDNNSFDSQELEREKENLKVDIEKILKDTGSYAMLRAKDIVDPGGRFSSSIYNHTDLIDKVNTNNLYDYYNKVIYNNHPLIYIFGNVEKDKIIKLCKKNLYRERFKRRKYSCKIKNYLPIREKTSYYCDESSFNNSVSVSFYKVKNMKKDDEMLLSVVKELLSSLSSRLLNKKLRDEYELVYSSYAITYINYGLLGVVAFIQADKVDLVREKIKEVILSLKDEKLILPLLENIKNRHRISLIRQLDDKLALFDECIVKDLKIELTSKENYKKLVNVTPKKIANFVDRLVLDTDYFLKEGKHE